MNGLNLSCSGKTSCVLVLGIIAASFGCDRPAPVKQKRKKKKGVKKSKRSLRFRTGSGFHAPWVPSRSEGMWPWTDLEKLDEAMLRHHGLKIPLAEIWKEGKQGLALSVVGLRGCTASFVSSDGLLLTNHHCAFTAIQRNSTPKRDLVRDGFLARNRSEELNGYGVEVLVFKSQKDVTSQILSGMPPSLSDGDTIRFIERREKELVARCEKKINTSCKISRENNGLRFLLLENLKIRDVRLVAAPPRALGEYGGEKDNWRWPRHSMDFTFMRAYVGKDGTPKPYSSENIPFRPKRFLEIASKGISEGDFVMVLGRPYHTSRYVTRKYLRQQVSWYYPARAELFASWIDLLKKTALQFPDARIPTLGTMKGLHNGLTHARGMVEGIRLRRLLEKKQNDQKLWRVWVAADPERKKKWHGTLDALDEYHEAALSRRKRSFYIDYLVRGVKLFNFAWTVVKWAKEQRKPDIDREKGFQERDRQSRITELTHAQRSFHPEADQRVCSMFLGLMGRLPPDERLKALDRALKGSYEKRATDALCSRLYRGSKLDTVKGRLELFGRPSEELLRLRDSMMGLVMDAADELDGHHLWRKKHEGALFRLRRPYLASIIEFRGSRFYPDANASPRITMATVAGYWPSDGVWHVPFTTLRGLLAKHTGKPPFDLPPDVLQKARSRDIGPYASPTLKDLTICFLSNADTTGGNSGSPVLDGNGRLVGLNFDRVYENIAGDFSYSSRTSRNIMVDIRAILWYLDRVVKADALVKELTGKASDAQGRSSTVQ